MLELISNIIQKFGPRPAGSHAEHQAQLYVAEQCKKLTDNVQVLEFDEYLYARFGKLKYYCLLFYISLALYFFSPKAAFLISLANALVFVLDFMTYRVVLGNFPGPKVKSWNVEATLEPHGEVKNTLIFSGHIDSVFEFKWWYKLGQTGIHLTVVAGLLIVLLPVFYLLTLQFGENVWWQYVFFVFVVLSPATISYFNMHGNNPVDGASDNLTGVSIAYALLKYFANPTEKGKSTLKNTRIKFVSFGSEETGLSGSKNYVKAKLNELKKEKAHLINIDTIRLPNEVCIVQKETMNGVKYNRELIEGLKKSFATVQTPIKTGKLPIGGTDGVSFVRAGLSAVSIVGLSTQKLDPTYHTRRDVIENVNPLALENTKKGLVEFIEQWDKRNL